MTCLCNKLLIEKIQSSTVALPELLSESDISLGQLVIYFYCLTSSLIWHFGPSLFIWHFDPSLFIHSSREAAIHMKQTTTYINAYPGHEKGIVDIQQRRHTTQYRQRHERSLLSTLIRPAHSTHTAHPLPFAWAPLSSSTYSTTPRQISPGGFATISPRNPKMHLALDSSEVLRVSIFEGWRCTTVPVPWVATEQMPPEVSP